MDFLFIISNFKFIHISTGDGDGGSEKRDTWNKLFVNTHKLNSILILLPTI